MKNKLIAAIASIFKFKRPDIAKEHGGLTSIRGLKYNGQKNSIKYYETGVADLRIFYFKKKNNPLLS